MKIAKWGFVWKQKIEKKDKVYAYPDRASFEIDVYGIDRELARVLEETLRKTVEAFVDHGLQYGEMEGDDR